VADSGFDASVLSEFRQRLITGHAELLLFETMLTRFRAQGLLKATGRQRTDSTHVLAAIQTRNRLEGIGETLRHALNGRATVAPKKAYARRAGILIERYNLQREEDP
jgi:transposase